MNGELVIVIPATHQVTAAVFYYIGTSKTLTYPSAYRGQKLCRISNFTSPDSPTTVQVSIFLQTACTNTLQIMASVSEG